MTITKKQLSAVLRKKNPAKRGPDAFSKFHPQQRNLGRI
jgi:hypothetical protein